MTPLIPLQGWTWRLNHGKNLLLLLPGMQQPATVELELESTYRQLQAWLQIACFWHKVIGRSMVCDADYDAIREAAKRWHEDDPDSCELPIYWYWNWLPDRYDDWVVRLFDAIPREQWKPRYPWIVGEKGIWNKPLDLEVKSGIMKTAVVAYKPPQPKLGFSFPEENP